jgi:hypothetical protein
MINIARVIELKGKIILMKNCWKASVWYNGRKFFGYGNTKKIAASNLLAELY